MALLIFPANPTDGQIYTGGNGVVYTYSTVPGVWTASAGSSSVLPAGTVWSFYQAAAPVGWTQNTVNDRSVRIVSGVGGGSGGTIGFSTLFSPTSSYSGSITISSGQVGDTVLNTAQLASHVHTITRSWPTAPQVISPYDGWAAGNRWSSVTGVTTSSTGSNQAHTHSLVGATANGNFTSNFDLQYVNIILATKN